MEISSLCFYSNNKYGVVFRQIWLSLEQLGLNPPAVSDRMRHSVDQFYYHYLRACKRTHRKHGITPVAGS